MINIIRELKVPKVIFRYILMNFLDLKTIENAILTVKEMNVLDNHSKEILSKAKKGFIWNCANDHIDVARWLFSLGSVDIYADDECAFRESCKNGHLNVAQWLYSLGDVDIHAGNEYAFRWSCREVHINIAQWLYSLGGVDIHAED